MSDLELFLRVIVKMIGIWGGAALFALLLLACVGVYVHFRGRGC